MRGSKPADPPIEADAQISFLQDALSKMSMNLAATERSSQETLEATSFEIAECERQIADCEQRILAKEVEIRQTQARISGLENASAAQRRELAQLQDRLARANSALPTAAAGGDAGARAPAAGCAAAPASAADVRAALEKERLQERELHSLTAKIRELEAAQAAAAAPRGRGAGNI
eukprot:tig00000498_g1620.t1